MKARHTKKSAWLGRGFRDRFWDFPVSCRGLALVDRAGEQEQRMTGHGKSRPGAHATCKRGGWEKHGTKLEMDGGVRTGQPYRYSIRYLGSTVQRHWRVDASTGSANPFGPHTSSGVFFKELVREFPDAVESFPERAHPLAGTGTTWGPNTTAPVGSV